jgi:hypothetical protein
LPRAVFQFDRQIAGEIAVAVAQGKGAPQDELEHRLRRYETSSDVKTVGTIRSLMQEVNRLSAPADATPPWLQIETTLGIR